MAALHRDDERDRRGAGFTVLRAAGVEEVARGVVTVRMVSPDGRALPLWQPGAHVRCVLPSGRVRPFSLCGDPDDRSTYVVAVQRKDRGKGGSREMHAPEFVGSRVIAHGPYNSFELVPASSYVFVAGGIGIAPIRPMANAASRAGVPWQLVYIASSNSQLPFERELRRLPRGRVAIVPSASPAMLDLARWTAQVAPGGLVYCCGSTDLIEAVQDACGSIVPPGRLHTEGCQWPAPTHVTALGS
jgi:ferredoxin-NADP reductase